MWCLIARLHLEFISHLLLVVIPIEQHADLAMVAPLTDVLFSLALDDVVDLYFGHAFGPEFVDPFRQFVRVT